MSRGNPAAQNEFHQCSEIEYVSIVKTKGRCVFFFDFFFSLNLFSLSQENCYTFPHPELDIQTEDLYREKNGPNSEKKT